VSRPSIRPGGAAGWSRRSLLLSALAAPVAWALPARTLQFPHDFGSHPALRTEWWYITGHAADAGGREFGFQLTFFRSRVDATQGMASQFASRRRLPPGEPLGPGRHRKRHAGVTASSHSETPGRGPGVSSVKQMDLVPVFHPGSSV